MRILVYGCAGHLLGGIETFLLNMNAHMSDNCIFDYVIIGDSCLHSKAILEKGGRIFYVAPIKKKPLKHMCDLFHVFKNAAIDTDIAYFNLFSMAYPVPIWVAAHYRYKVILHAHNSGLQSKNRIYFLLHKIGQFLLRKVDTTHWANSRLSETFMFGKSINAELIYNAIDVYRFRYNAIIREDVRNQNNGSGLVVGFIGRLEDPKNPIFALEIFYQIVQVIPNAILWIIGEGSLRADMEEKIECLGIKDFVRWFGQRKDVEKLMQGIDLLLQPSLFEGLGIVLVEGQAAGLPCITSAEVVPVEVNVSSYLKYISLQETPESWAHQCINFFFKNKDQKRENGYDAVSSSNFDIQKEAKRMESLFQQIENS